MTVVRSRGVSGVVGLVAAVAVVAAALGSLASGQGARTRGREPASRARALADYGTLPLSFERNRGQAPSAWSFLARGPGYALGLGRGWAALSLSRGDRARADLVRILPVGGRLGVPVAESRLPGVVSDMTSPDRTHWVRGAPTYSRVVYPAVWPGIDLAFHGRQGLLEYDLQLAPGADPSRIGLQFPGVEALRGQRSGGAVLQLEGGALTLPPPRAFQLGRTVPSRLVIHDGTVGVAVGRYDRSEPLLVDPGLIYSTYLGHGGGSLPTWGRGIAVDSAGEAFVTGETFDAFPTTAGSFQPTTSASKSAFVAKLNASGTALEYSTYFGHDAESFGIAIDGSGDAYILGSAQGQVPTTPGAFRPTYGAASPNSEGFVAKLNPAGTALLYSTFLGGSGVTDVRGIAVDTAGDAYVTGGVDTFNTTLTFNDYPTTPGAFQTTTKVKSGSTEDSVFVTKLNPPGSGQVYSTFLSGSLNDRANGIAIDPAGNAYVTGDTDSVDFPTTPGSYQPTTTSPSGFVTKLNPTGSPIYSTDFPKSPTAIAADSAGNTYLTGFYGSTDIPSTPCAYLAANDPTAASTLTKLNPNGSSIVYSTSLPVSGNAITVDQGGNAYIAGAVTSFGASAFKPTPDAVQQSIAGPENAFVTKLRSDGTGVVYQTFLGGNANDEALAIALDPAGNIYLTGDTTSTTFPTTPGALDSTNNNLHPAFVAAIAGTGTAPTSGGTCGAKPPAPKPSAPKISRASLAAAAFTRRTGTKLNLTLSKPASVRVVVTQTFKGRKVRGVCKANAKHGKRCTGVATRVTLSFPGRSGANIFPFRPNLLPGRYAATITATDSSGLQSASVTLHFTIKPAPHSRHRRSRLSHPCKRRPGRRCVTAIA